MYASKKFQDVSKVNFTVYTGKSLSEAHIFVSTNPQYDGRLFIELQVQYMKIPSSNLGATCCVQKLFPTFRTIFVHYMISPCSAKKRASDKDLPVLVVLLTGQLKPARTVLTYLHRTVPPSMGLSIWCGLVCTGLEWARSLAQTSARIGRRPASPPVAVFPCTGIQWVQWVCTYGTSAHRWESLMEKIY